ncbi:MAG: hypothetical protein MZV70_28685 [Desulfobacterales bacterium]|nr:hypothetical protein [Desulfobacterales bacterium]
MLLTYGTAYRARRGAPGGGAGRRRAADGRRQGDQFRRRPDRQGARRAG